MPPHSYPPRYKSLRKPAWNPPNWVFPAVWIPLKLMQSTAAALVWAEARTQTHPTRIVAVAAGAFSAQLLLGNLWNL